jgi:hypothetical protein
MEKKGILLSHFNIYKFTKNLLIKIFLYNTDFEKYIYSYYARGVGIFSDSFFYRYKKKKKKKEPFCYDRYKPDLFFLLFLYYGYFSKKKVKRRIQCRKGFMYIVKKSKNTLKFKSFNAFFLKEKMELSDLHLNNLKENNLDYFSIMSEEDSKKINKNNLSIPAYERKIKLLSSKKLNLGFLDFLVYIFFKINMLEKNKEDIIKNRKRRKGIEMILNYSLKFRK